MQHAIELPTDTESLKERLTFLEEALATCRRKKAQDILRAERDAVRAEIGRRRNLQTSLTGVQS